MPDKNGVKPNTSGPPWLPFKTLLNFIEWLGEVGVPQRIERSFWSKKLAGNMGPLVINALQFFGLIDEHMHATQALDEIAQNMDKRKEFFARQLQERYGQIFKTVNLERATRNQLSEEFAKVFSVRGSVQVKAVIFFVHLARYAGVNVSSHIVIRERKESSKPRSKKVTASEVGRNPPSPPGQKLPLKENARAEAQDSLLLWGLFQRLPKPGSAWPEAQRKQWLDTLQNVFALEYKDNSSAKGESDEEGNTPSRFTGSPA